MKNIAYIVVIVLIILVLLIVNIMRISSNKHLLKVGGAIDMIQWDDSIKCYPPEMITNCQKFIQGMISDSNSFGPVNIDDRRKLNEYATQLNHIYKVNISVDHLIIWRTMELALLSNKVTKKQTSDILESDMRGELVVNISKRLGVSPVMVLRQILMSPRYASSILNANANWMIANPSKMPPPLYTQSSDIFEADLSSSINAGHILEQSRKFEIALGNHLTKLGIEFQTENEIREEYYKNPNQDKALITPDFLLTNPVNINGHLVYWIDAKNYPMYGSRLVERKLTEQAIKYTKAFGPGAMIFSGGIMCNAKLKNMDISPLILSGSNIHLV